jgi:hypothetical protein
MNNRESPSHSSPSKEGPDCGTLIGITIIAACVLGSIGLSVETYRRIEKQKKEKQHPTKIVDPESSLPPAAMTDDKGEDAISKSDEIDHQ